jgi:hypothetical protein
MLKHGLEKELSEGSEQLLIQLATLPLVSCIYSRQCFVHRVDAESLYLEPLLNRQVLRLHGKVTTCYTLGLSCTYGLWITGTRTNGIEMVYMGARWLGKRGEEGEGRCLASL